MSTPVAGWFQRISRGFLRTQDDCNVVGVGVKGNNLTRIAMICKLNLVASRRRDRFVAGVRPNSPGLVGLVSRSEVAEIKVSLWGSSAYARAVTLS